MMTVERICMTDAFRMTGAEPDEVWPLVRDHHYAGRMPSNIQHCYAAPRRKQSG